MRRFLNRNVLLTLLFLLIALAVYFLNIQSQGEAVSISIGRFGEKNIVVVPAYHDGAVAWMEALFVTEVPTYTPPPSMTPTPDLVHTPTSTPKPTKTPKGTIASSPTPTDTLRPALTPTTHAYFTGYGQPISTYNTYGSSISAAPLTVDGRLYLVIADGTHGLHIVDVTDPNNPIDTRYTLKQANSVKVIGKTAYIAAGDEGVVILDLSNPRKPIAIDQRATIGPAIDLDVVFRGSSFVDKASGVNRPYYLTRIYVAMGSDGVQVITISPISKDPSKLDKDKHTIKNKGYSKAIYYDTEDRVLAITEAHYAGMNEFVFIADGNDGVKVLDLSNAYGRPIRDSDLVHSFDIPYAWDVAFGRLLEHRAKQDKQFYWLFVAAGKEGVRVYKVAIDSNVREATYTYIRAINTPGEARAITLYHNNIFVGDGEGGMEVIDFNDPDHPVLLGNGRYEFDWRSVPIIYALKEWLLHNIDSPGSAATIGNVAFDGVLCVVSLAVVAFFLTGFILPVRTFSDRLQVLRRVVANWLDLHGTAWVIEDGRLRHRTEQERKHGVGVILQDPNSAAIIDEHLGQPRVSGEQVTFTDKDEHLVWQTELRRRQLLIGPQHDDLDPFRTRGSNEERAEYRARQYRRRVAAGKTSDGVELVATLRVVYSLEGGAVSDQDEFGYEPGNVMRMYQGERPFPFDRNIDPVRYWRRRQSIEPLLEKFASEVWKLTCSRYTLAELFPPLYQNNASLGQPSAMQTIQTMLTDLLVDRQAGVLDGFGDATNIVEIREVFRELEGGQRPGGSRIGKSADPGRGVRVHEVKLEGISLSDDDTQRLLQQWIDDWRQGNPHPPVDTQVRADQEALIQFAEYAVQYFKEQPGSQPQVQRLVDSLVRLLQGTLRALPPGEDRKRLLAATRQLGGSER